MHHQSWKAPTAQPAQPPSVRSTAACRCWRVWQRRTSTNASGLHKQHVNAETGAVTGSPSLTAPQQAVKAVSWHADDAPDIADHARLQRQQLQLQQSTTRLQGQGQEGQKHQEQQHAQGQYLPKTRGRLGAAASAPGYFGSRAADASNTLHHSKHSWVLVDGAAASIAGSGQPWLLQLKARVAKLQQEVAQHKQSMAATPQQQGPSTTQQWRKHNKRVANSKQAGQQAQQQPQRQPVEQQRQQPAGVTYPAHNGQSFSTPVDTEFERWWASALAAARHWKEAAVLADAWRPPISFIQLELLLQRLAVPHPSMQASVKSGTNGTHAASKQVLDGSMAQDVQQPATTAPYPTPAVPANSNPQSQQLDNRTEERVHGLRAADWRSFCNWLGQQLRQQLEPADAPARQALVLEPSRAVALLAAIEQLDGAGMGTELLGQLAAEVPLERVGLQGLASLGCSASELGLLLRSSWLRAYAAAAAAQAEDGDGASAVGVLWALARYKQVPANEQATAHQSALAHVAVTSSASLQPPELRRLMVATAQLQLPLSNAQQASLLLACRSCLEAASWADVVQLLQGIAAQGWRLDADWWLVLFETTDRRSVAVATAGSEAAQAAAAGAGTDGTDAEVDGAAAADVSPTVRLRRQQHRERQQREQERRQRLQEGELGDAHPADGPQQQAPLTVAPVPAAAVRVAAELEEHAPSSEEVVGLLGLLLQLEAKPATGWTTRLLQAHCRGRHDPALLPQLLALLPQVLPDPKTWAPHNKNLLDQLLERSAEECLQMCGPQQLVQIVEALAQVKHRPSRPILAWLNSAILRLGRAFPLKPLLQVRAAYLQLEKEPSEPRVSELFYVAYQKMVDRAKAAERAEAQAAGRKLGEKPSKAELARTWRKRKLKPPGTLKRVV